MTPDRSSLKCLDSWQIYVFRGSVYKCVQLINLKVIVKFYYYNILLLTDNMNSKVESYKLFSKYEQDVKINIFGSARFTKVCFLMKRTREFLRAQKTIIHHIII